MTHASALAMFLACWLAVGEAAAAISLPSDCSVVASPPSSPDNVLVAKTPVALSASCKSGDSPIRFAWSTGFAATVGPAITTSFAVVPYNDGGAGIPMQVTIYTGRTGALAPPSNCSITQTPQSRFGSRTAGSNVALRAMCMAGGPPTNCQWSDPSVGTSCHVSVPLPDQSIAITVTPSNAAGAAPTLTADINGASNPPFSSRDIVLRRANVTVNGAPLQSPQFVGAGDLFKFDTILEALPPSTGLGVCLELHSSIGAGKVDNIYGPGYIGPTSLAVQTLGADHCLASGSQRIVGADAVFITPWIFISGLWPAVPLPIKLYDTEFKIGASPTSASQVGFAIVSATGGSTFAQESPLLLCGKPKIVVASGSVTGSHATYGLFLSQGVSSACSLDGTYPVTLEVVAPASLAVVGVKGAGASLNGRTITIAVPADGVTTAAPFEVIFDQALPPASQALVQLAAGNYVDGGTALPSPVIPTVTIPINTGIGGGGPIIDFTVPPPTVGVATGGRAVGLITSNVGGIQCPPTCSTPYVAGTTIVLTATPGPGSQFAGWVNGCTGRGTCVLGTGSARGATALFAPATSPMNVDLDGNGRYDALSDGLLVVRSLHGLSTNDLTRGVLPAVTTALLERLIDIYPLLDIDGDGRPDALTDGILLQRYLFGLRGSALTANALAAGATRTSPAQIEAYIATLLP